MARMYPAEFHSGPWSEKFVYEKLRGLSDEWFVVHDVRFPVERGSEPVEDGQADFVLLHPRHGVVVLEVKGGHIEARDGVWTTTNSDGTHSIKDPFDQVIRNKYALLAQIRRQFGVDPWTMHAVVFPTTGSADGPFGLHDPDIVIFKNDLDVPQATLDRVVAAHQPRPQGLSVQQLERIAARLAPTVAIRPLLVDVAKDAELEVLRLTEQQRQVLQFARSYTRVWIRGGAGTGKTVLAVERARQLAADGRRVLLLCYNEPLGKYLRECVADLSLVTAGNYHSVATRTGGLSRPLDLTENDWLEWGFNEAFFDQCVSSGLRWDSVIIDEAQDFNPIWLETLDQLLVSDESSMLAFADENQDIFRAAGVAGMPEAPLHLDMNCRNTPQIGRRAAEAIGLPSNCLSRSDGLEPTLAVVPGRARLLKELRSSVHRLMAEQGFKVDDVVLLSPSRSLVDDLQGTRIGRWSVVPMFESGLVCETIQRFKGLESMAVILLLPDVGPHDPKLAYVGMSRARSVLQVVAEPTAAGRLRWEEPIPSTSRGDE